MAIWAIADLHLSLRTEGKEMDVFGRQWVRHYEKIKEHWTRHVGEDDLVLVAGDISWAKHAHEAAADLEWIGNLPGTKAMIKGNHEYWWDSIGKARKICPPSVFLIQNDVFRWKDDIEVGGTRLWDTPEYDFEGYVVMQDNPRVKQKPMADKDNKKNFERELQRLEMSLKAFSKNAGKRIMMTHYPPIGPELQSSRASSLMEKYGVELCVFGHLHNVVPGSLPFGSVRGITYHLTSCDYLDFQLLRVG